jgi:hypothetical protein
MRYHWFHRCGLFTGPGVVEASCKQVIGQRLKSSGMHWTVSRASAIATLRSHQASCPDDHVWQQAHYQTGTT